jgi:hypothetical protein
MASSDFASFQGWMVNYVRDKLNSEYQAYDAEAEYDSSLTLQENKTNFQNNYPAGTPTSNRQINNQMSKAEWEQEHGKQEVNKERYQDEMNRAKREGYVRKDKNPEAYQAEGNAGKIDFLDKDMREAERTGKYVGHTRYEEEFTEGGGGKVYASVGGHWEEDKKPSFIEKAKKGVGDYLERREKSEEIKRASNQQKEAQKEKQRAIKAEQDMKKEQSKLERLQLERKIRDTKKEAVKEKIAGFKSAVSGGPQGEALNEEFGKGRQGGGMFSGYGQQREPRRQYEVTPAFDLDISKPVRTSAERSDNALRDSLDISKRQPGQQGGVSMLGGNDRFGLDMFSKPVIGRGPGQSTGGQKYKYRTVIEGRNIRRERVPVAGGEPGGFTPPHSSPQQQAFGPSNSLAHSLDVFANPVRAQHTPSGQYQHGSPGLSGRLDLTSSNGHKFDVAQKMNFGSPKMDFSFRMNTATPKKNMATPRMSMASPKMNLSPAKLNFGVGKAGGFFGKPGKQKGKKGKPLRFF